MHHWHGLTLAAAVSIVAIVGLVMFPGSQFSGALSFSDQAVYEMGLTAFNRCDPSQNPFIQTPRQRSNCCSQACFTPCLTSGIPDCDTICKPVCLEKPIWSAGGTP